ncbi:MAG: hypothetical protein J0M15_05540 [Deltaproteobacteria bacterium]|nr:hypothetical protein [Deltaproteobacteria bacterium]
MNKINKSQLKSKDVSQFNKKFVEIKRDTDLKISNLEKTWKKKDTVSGEQHKSEVFNYYSNHEFGNAKIPLGKIKDKNGNLVTYSEKLKNDFKSNFVNAYLAPFGDQSDFEMSRETEPFDQISLVNDESAKNPRPNDKAYHFDQEIDGSTFYFSKGRLVATFIATITRNESSGGVDIKRILTRYDNNCMPKEILRTETKSDNLKTESILWRVNLNLCTQYLKEKKPINKDSQFLKNKEYNFQIDLSDEDTEENLKDLIKDLTEACKKFPSEKPSSASSKGHETVK